LQPDTLTRIVGNNHVSEQPTNDKTTSDLVSLDYPGRRRRHSRNGLHGHSIPRDGICSRKGTSLLPSGRFLAFRSGRESTPRNSYCVLKKRRYKKDVITIHPT
jgi:hypothetical protein